jgi:hypothetical protein
MLGELLQFYMFPWKYFFSMKWERSKEIKRELLAQGEVPVLLLRFGNIVRLTPSSDPPLGVHTCTRTSLTTLEPIE